ncbi:MAG: acyltransferase [Robiginitomaculum sp.]|nr:MAG: acyltransferase [Robiginitomaculum sp.]
MIKPENHVPESAPRIGNRFTRFIGRCILRAFGYTFEGKFANEPKLVLIVSPHTSNWDLFLAIGTILALGVRINFMMKKEAFFFPLKSLFIALGGVPIDRSNPKRVVASTLRGFRDREKFWLAILPEGTRKPVNTWKSGFVRIAHKADVPIFIMGVDSRTKTLHLDKMVSAGPKALEQAEELRLYSKERYCGINPENN